MFIIVIAGLFLLFLFRKKSELSKVITIILTFSTVRIIFGFGWKSITGNINIINSTNNFNLLLLVNFILLSVLFIFGAGCLIKQKFSSLGWTGNKIFKNIFVGLAAGAFFFFLLTFNKTIKFENLLFPAVFFSFFIASWQEENIFRGYLFNYLKKKFNKEKTIICQALIYSLAHIGFYEFLPISNLIASLLFAFILGVIFGYLRMETESQIPAFISHGIINVAFLV